MSAVFFFGTLRHAPLLEAVLGRGLAELDIRADALEGYRVEAVAEGPFPMLRGEAGARAQGVVVSGLTEADRARLDYFEAGFAFDVVACTTEAGVCAQVYMPRAALPGAGVWDFEAWVAQWGAMSVYAAQEVMEGFGTVPPEEVARRFPRIRARAWSKVLARNPRYGAGTLSGAVEMEARRYAYSNFFAIQEVALRHERFDGSLSEPLERAIFVASDAAILLPYDPVRDRVLLVEQIRMGPIGRDDPVLWHMEPVAGFVDPGEQPEEAARREAIEEAGLQLQEVHAVAGGYPSPGATSEFYHLFVGICDLPDGSAGVGGEVEEGENIRAHLMAFEALLAMAEDRRTSNQPLALLTYWLAHHRTRLRNA